MEISSHWDVLMTILSLQWEFLCMERWPLYWNGAWQLIVFWTTCIMWHLLPSKLVDIFITRGKPFKHSFGTENKIQNFRLGAILQVQYQIIMYQFFQFILFDALTSYINFIQNLKFSQWKPRINGQIFQKTFPNAFSWMKKYKFWYKSGECISRIFQLKIREN